MAEITPLQLPGQHVNARAMIEELLQEYPQPEAVIIAIRTDDVWKSYWAGDISNGSLAFGSIVIRREIEASLMGEDIE